MKFTKNELINENKPDPRILRVYDLNMKCILGLQNLFKLRMHQYVSSDA